MSDLVGNPEDRFSRVAAQIVSDKSELAEFFNYYFINIAANLKNL